MKRLILLKPGLLKLSLLLLLMSHGISAAAATKPATRIIALSPHSVEMLYAIGAGERIVATLDFADYPEAALAIPRIGNFTGIQIERVLELQPDLIIVWKGGNKSTDINKLESLGFKILYSQPKNIDEISRELIRLGEVTGLVDNAKVVAQKLANEYIQIKQRYSQKQKVSVFYQLWHDPLRTVGADNWNQSLIKDCNGTNIFADSGTPYPVVSMENVLIKNPQIIIIPHHSGSETVKKDIWSKWKNIDAVKNKKIFTIDGDLLHRFSPRAIEGLELLCRAIDSARSE